MRVYTNDPYIKRRAKIGQYVSWAGLAVLALGLFITVRTSPGTFLRFSNDPSSLAREVSRNRNAIGFMGFDELALANDPVQLLAIDGVTPSEETIASGEYPLVDPSGAVAVIISPQNTWIGQEGVSMALLAELFSTENERWLDVTSGWPNSAMVRYSLPEEGNAAYATFVTQVMEPVYGARAEEVLLGTVNPNYSRMVLASFACLGIGFIAAQIGSYNQRRFNRPPRPDERLAKALKGFDDRYSLYSWMLPAAYVFLGPTGVYTFALREQGGQVTNAGDKWKHKGSKLGFLLAFSNEGIGNPTLDAQSDAAKMEKYIAQHRPDVAVEVQPLALFINPQVKLDLKSPTIPAVKPDQLKTLLRSRTKDNRLDPAALQQLQTLFETPSR
jgi:hypothetical protein